MKAREGLLITCDTALKTWLIYQDSQLGSMSKFIISNVDDTHLFIKNDDNIVRWIIEKMDEWHDSNAYQQPTEYELQQQKDKQKY